MKTIMLLVGLPGSGKSTWTNDFLRTEHFQVVSRDDIRATFGVDGHNTNGLNPDTEAAVAHVAEHMLEAFMVRGLNVVLDETHTSIRNVRKVRAVADMHGYDVHAVYFRIPAEESKARRPGIPRSAIDRMARNLLETLPALEVWAELGMIASFTRHG